MLLLRFVLDIPPSLGQSPAPTHEAPRRSASPQLSSPADPLENSAPDPLAFDAPTAFAEWAFRLEQSPLLRPRPWGSAFLADPWPKRLPRELHPTVNDELQRRYAQQAAGAPHSLSWHTISSQSRVRLEAHESALVLDVSIPGSTVAADAHRSLPADVATLLQPLPLLQEADLLSALAPLSALPLEVGMEPLLLARRALQRLGGLWYDDLRLLDVLRLYADHPLPSVRASTIAVASHVGYPLFLLERAACETDALLRRVLHTVTAWVAPEPTRAETPPGTV